MKNKTPFYALAVISLLMIIASQGLTVSDFISGLILGLGIALEFTALIAITKTMKNSKEEA